MRTLLPLVLGLSLVIAACGDDGGGDEGPLGPRALFKLNPSSAAEFYDLPFPSDLRRDPDGTISLAHFPDPSPRIIVPDYVRAAEELTGFGTTTVVYFRFSESGPKEGELVFTVGNPGSTGRLLTLAQLERMRDVYYPIVLETIAGAIAAMTEYAKTGAKAEQEVRNSMFSLANTQKAFTGYLGEDREAWKQYDASELIRAQRYPRPILIDQGARDKFLTEQLRPELFAEAVRDSGSELQFRMHPGYDHGYYFISTFMEDHLRHHARQLSTA